MLFAALTFGVVLGAFCAWLVLRSRASVLVAGAQARITGLETSLEHERRGGAEKVRMLEQATEQLSNSFKALSADALRDSNASFLQLAKSELEKLQAAGRGDLEQRQRAVEGLVAPIRESLEKVDGHVRSLEHARREAYGAVVQQLKSVAEGQERLRHETGGLVTALRAPHVRGRWGEVQLKRVVEATGMLEHCDFTLQSTTRDGDGALLRPDLIVRLPGKKQVIVDAKVPLAAYLDACQSQDESSRMAFLHEHARQLRDHVGKLSAKAYWRQFEPAPDFVIMFLPDETLLRAACECDSTIGEDAWASNVIPASPTNLFALLRTIAAVWHQETVAESAREVHSLGQELYSRLATMGSHFQQLGRSLASATGNYNKTLGALESRVLVSGRKLEAHGIAAEMPDLAPIDVQPRPLTAPELLAGDSTIELVESNAA
ncbi:MAG: DNA recombination protein RmuC [Actinobacteria bacterium]|nr:DNA recombination protein RmuC [Actinomycetota bacterium]